MFKWSDKCRSLSESSQTILWLNWDECNANVSSQYVLFGEKKRKESIWNVTSERKKSIGKFPHWIRKYILELWVCVCLAEKITPFICCFMNWQSGLWDRSFSDSSRTRTTLSQNENENESSFLVLLENRASDYSFGLSPELSENEKLWDIQFRFSSVRPWVCMCSS